MNQLPTNNTRVHCMVALACEAKPLIRHFRLSRQMDEKLFPVYCNESMILTVTGVGKTAMAAGTVYTYCLAGRPENGIWLNIGVAGHPEFSMGQVALAHKVTDFETRRSWYPPLLFKPPCGTEALITVSKPELRYSGAALFDMEASGFYDALARFSTLEMGSCLKIVSDNRKVSAEELDSQRVSVLVENSIDRIGQLIELQRQLVTVIPDNQTDERIGPYMRRWRFSAQQTVQLESLLQRWALLNSETCPTPNQLRECENARQVLAYLREEVDKLPMIFSAPEH